MRRWLAALGCAVLLWVLLPAGARAEGTPAVENAVRTAAGEWGAARSAMPGETVLCRVRVRLWDGGAYVLRGRLSPGLDFGEVASLRCGGGAVNASLYTIVTAYQGEWAFSVHLAEGFAAGDGELEMEYTVRLNDAAAVGAGANTAAVTAEDARGAAREGAAAAVETFALEVYRGVRLPETAGQSNPVPGACLCLYADAALRQRVAFRERGEDTYLACAGEGCAHTRHLYVVRTPQSGRLRLEGLGAGTYYLQETRPPEGLTVTVETREITVTETGAVFSGGVACAGGTVSVLHSPTAAEPEYKTADPLAFYRRGSRVLAAALTFLIATRRYYLY